MRKLILLATMALAAAVMPSALASAAPAPAPATSAQTAAAPASVEAGPTAAQLLAKTNSCTQVSSGKYKTDEDVSAKTVAVCDANGAVFWKADMDIDCDGQRTTQCNEDTDCCYQDDTAFHQSDGKPLSAAKLPYIVVPSSSSIWKYTSSQLKGGGSCAVIYNGKIEYAVIGDTGPTQIIGEASYATAKDLGINPDPSNGGTDSGVTYICFKNSTVSPIENHANAISKGESLATTFVNNN
ncbi:glycoside hydrolase family 75 protein [Amycolatopsis sp. WQ 127309]|uniref:glycoside hydrolase family 75 protein n=1 Tax=Amycolatopsis sp. WQ 127309 TaxID=2932773 RepID=UPI001FF23BEF|nr:glycoside hydrolase family 75 protein [Amycolatopsis sp. WQ 127309]UOZ09549.1 glycoside hydrolase family 75 protein [Amycolatopsis sp. WQ 127309]